MNYLLDTHAIIWYFEDSAELPIKITELIDDPDNKIYISSVSLWEIAIKMSIGKLDLNIPFDELLKNIKIRDFNILQIEDEYLKKLLDLSFMHKDPFDRLIISLALAEDLTIVTVDENIKKYNIPWVW
ncbi:MAG: type II toxin-antitoxin system VapC family toxin [Oscillospiraceae bacterium]|nr:type II toxin-antitoxin system VapC family toxin [Oscillospiraceae bacterium]